MGSRELVSGALAGLAVDLSLHPLDTLKTRLQSSAGLWGSGGLTRVYAGMGSVAVGSAPGAALFFLGYEGAKARLAAHLPPPAAQASAAVLGETLACLVRVPTEVLKQRAQAFPKRDLRWVLRRTLGESGGARGLYRGFRSTLFRELPFSFLQFPLWEGLKRGVGRWRGRRVGALEGAGCGSVAGMAAGSVTTPLDVAKTRIMLAEEGSVAGSGAVGRVLAEVWREGGLRGLYAGLLPRTAWLGLGGFVFFGAYELSKALWDAAFDGQTLGSPLLVWDYHRLRLIETLTDKIFGETVEEGRGPRYETRIEEAQMEIDKIEEQMRAKAILDLLDPPPGVGKRTRRLP